MERLGCEWNISQKRMNADADERNLRLIEPMSAMAGNSPLDTSNLDK